MLSSGTKCYMDGFRLTIYLLTVSVKIAVKLDIVTIL